MMMNGFDLGGCCLARYGTAAPYFVSKTDQIMSRYRPIAPKPAAAQSSPGGVVEAALQQHTPAENSKIRACSRSRKRSWDSAAGGHGSSGSPRGQKRAARVRCHVSDVPEHPQQSNASLPLSTVCHTHTHSHHTHSHSQSHSYSQSQSHCPHSDTSEDGISTLCEIADSEGTSTGAASLNFGLRPRTYSCIGFDTLKNKEGPLEKDAAFMERAAASASPTVNLHGLISEMRGRALDQAPSALHRQKQDVVTLPLLPVVPNCRADSTTSGTEVKAGGVVIQSPFEDDSQSLPQLGLSDTTTRRSRCPFPGPVPVVDISVVEQLYSASSDPLILTDDSYSHRVIWYNPAYNRLLSLSASELGILKPLATFNLDSQPSTAVLWGFAAKFPGPDQNREASPRVIMPQPVRPVGSSVVVECITETHLLEGMSAAMSMEEVEEQLESKTSPCLISDSQKKVRWANSAYKQMVGQPECSWLEKESNKVVRIQGQVLLLFNLQLPQSVAAFSCRVKIQWNNAGDKTSITVPCDVFRIDASSHSLAWHFDIQAALCL